MARISHAAAERLRAELDELRGPGRAAVAQALIDARAAGKMEENSDYWIADEARDRLEARIVQLEDTLAEAVVTDDGIAVGSTVIEGCLVEVRFDGDEETERFYVGAALGAPEGVDTVTLASPMGQAIAGAEVGGTVTYKAPTGAVISVEIVGLEAA